MKMGQYRTTEKLKEENTQLKARNEELMYIVSEVDKHYNGLSVQRNLSEEGLKFHQRMKKALQGE